MRTINRQIISLAAALFLIAAISPAEEKPLVLWGKSIQATTVDDQRTDLPLPEWLDKEAILGAPDGKWGRAVLHNGWNDHASITIDLGGETAWGELVLIHRQQGPGASKSTTVSVAGEKGDFHKLGRAPLNETATTTVFEYDTPVRYVRIGIGAGGAVGVDSTWYFDAVGTRTGREALGRATALKERVDAIGKALDALKALDGPAQTLRAEGRQRLEKQIAAVNGIDKLALDAVLPAIAAIKAELNQLDTLVMRLMAGESLAPFNNGKMPAFMATWMPSMAKVRPAEPLRASDVRVEGAMALAGRERESIQLVLAAGDSHLRDVQVELDPLAHEEGGHVIASEHVTVGYLKQVRVNGDLWPDPIVPLQGLTVPAGAQQALRIQVYAPAGTPAGMYHTIAHVRAAGVSALSLPLNVRVYDFDLPVRAHTAHIVSCGGGGVDEVLFPNRTTTGGGPCTGSIAQPKYILKMDGSIAIDFTEYDAIMTRAFESGLAKFSLPLSGGDGGGYKPGRMSPKFHIEATGAEEPVSMDPLESEEAKKRLVQWLKIFTDHLREKGWFERCFFYLWDEPNPRYTKTILTVGRAVKEAVPDIKILIVESPHKQWHEVADIYCPQGKWFGREKALAEAAELRAMGKEMWWYNCGDPAPFPTYGIGHPAACARMSFLLMWKLELTGNLYWAAGARNGINDETILENPGADGRGDGMLVYRHATAGTVPSMRLEMIRDGIEDYEYLWILRDRVNAAKKRGVDVSAQEGLLELPPEVAADAAHYTHDPAVIEGWRACIAEAIEALAQKR